MKPQSTMFMAKSGSMIVDSAASTSPSLDTTAACRRESGEEGGEKTAATAAAVGGGERSRRRRRQRRRRHHHLRPTSPAAAHSSLLARRATCPRDGAAWAACCCRCRVGAALPGRGAARPVVEHMPAAALTARDAMWSGFGRRGEVVCLLLALVPLQSELLELDSLISCNKLHRGKRLPHPDARASLEAGPAGPPKLKRRLQGVPRQLHSPGTATMRTSGRAHREVNYNERAAGPAGLAPGPAWLGAQQGATAGETSAGGSRGAKENARPASAGAVPPGKRAPKAQAARKSAPAVAQKGRNAGLERLPIGERPVEAPPPPPLSPAVATWRSTLGVLRGRSRFCRFSHCPCSSSCLSNPPQRMSSRRPSSPRRQPSAVARRQHPRPPASKCCPACL